MKTTNVLTKRMENILGIGFEVMLLESNSEFYQSRSICGGHITVEGGSLVDVNGEAYIRKFKFFGGADAESEEFEGMEFVKAERLGKGRLWISL